jgi:hypothetical protein
MAMLGLLSLVTVGGYHLMSYVTQAVGDPVIIGGVQSFLAGLVLFLAIDHRRHGISASHSHGAGQLVGLETGAFDVQTEGQQPAVSNHMK